MEYNLRSDLMIEALENLKPEKGVVTNIKNIGNVKVTNVIVEKDGVLILNKKEGNYTTIEFDNIVDTSNNKKVEEIFVNELKELIKLNNIKENNTCLIVGLGNDLSTPDSLGPSVIKNVIVTKHLFDINRVSEGYREVSAIRPGVMGQTGIETSEIILGIIDRVKPDFLIIVDSLAALSISRINKTIQMTDTGIHQGSGEEN